MYAPKIRSGAIPSVLCALTEPWTQPPSLPACGSRLKNLAAQQQLPRGTSPPSPRRRGACGAKMRLHNLLNPASPPREAGVVGWPARLRFLRGERFPKREG